MTLRNYLDRFRRALDKFDAFGLSEQIDFKEEIAMSTAEKLRNEGRKEGRKEAGYGSYFNVIHTMKKNNIPDEEIARLTNLDIETVRKIANKEKVDIPLHLLEPNG